MGRPKKSPQTEKRCARCREVLPAEAFYRRPSTGHLDAYCRPCKRRLLRRYKPPSRPPRYNARGDAWCNRCEHYLPVTRFRWLSPPSFAKPRLASYCIDCTREIDRDRYSARTGTEAGALRELERRNERGRRQHAVEYAERRAFVKNAILLLRQRGLTKAEIAKLAGTRDETILILERGERRPTPNMAERFSVLLRETAHLPAGKEPAYRRRLPHPELPVLLARCRPQIDALPVRSRWKDREERLAA